MIIDMPTELSAPSASRGAKDMHYVYMIKSRVNELYTGTTQNIHERIYAHNNNQGAEFTRNKKDFTLVFLEEYNTLKEAGKREMQIKKWRREKKDLLIDNYSHKLPTKK